MNILIDFTQIPVQKCGIGVYALNLISCLCKQDTKNTYYILVQDDDNSLDFISNPRFHKIKVNSKLFRKIIFMPLLEQFIIPYLALKHKIDVIHSLHYSFPLLSVGRKVVLIPDMTFFKFPQYHLFLKVLYFRFFTFMASFFADKIVTISESSKRDFLEKFPVDKDMVKVIYLGKDSSFNGNLDKNRIEEVKTKYGIENEYVLYIGTIEPRKNITSLIRAFSSFANVNKNCQLVIAGKKGWHYNSIFSLVNKLSLSERIIFTGFVLEEDKPFLIGGAKIFVYPSFYEGFGIPVLESLACGIPTITSNISSLPEVTADAALLIDPVDVDGLYKGIKRLFDDDILYAHLKEKSLKQAEKFNWDKTAQETVNIYNSLA